MKAGTALILIFGFFITTSSQTGDAFGVHEGLHFTLESRATNIDGSHPTYKNPKASIEDRVNDLLPRMTLDEKVAQMSVAAEHIYWL